MKSKLSTLFLTASIIIAVVACNPNGKKGDASNNDSNKVMTMKERLEQFATVKLTTDLSKLTPKEKEMLHVLIEISKIMDELYWMQTIGEKKSFLDTIKDPDLKRFAEINYGPWERLGDDKPFMPFFNEKPKGANFYPHDMTKDEFDNLKDPNKTNQYTVIKRNDDKSLMVVWFHEEYYDLLFMASNLLKKAAGLAEDPGLKHYFELRSKAILTDNYFESDMAWMDMKTNHIDFVVGPIENYEDALYGYKTAYEAAVLVKDNNWSKKLEKYTSMLPELQKQLPCDQKYKNEMPGSNSDLNAYDIIYYAGHSNAGGKTIAINLPNDEKVQLAKGSRRLQLKNAMQAKFDKILTPIANVLIDKSQQKNITFNAFFSNVMFHEVAHGLGIKNTITGKGTCKAALKEKYGAFEEAKADILGLFIVGKLIEKGELKDVTIEDSYVTFMAGLIRSVRFGAADAHGKANMMCFNFFEDAGAFTRNADGTYKVDMAKTKKALEAWSAMVLKFEGDGDYEGATKYLTTNSVIRKDLQTDIAKLKTANIPVDIIFDQGVEALGLK